MALQCPNATTVQAGRNLDTAVDGLSNVPIHFMPRDLSALAISETEPLITYNIGRRRIERELVMWFGKRITKSADVEVLVEKRQHEYSKKSKQTSNAPDKLDLLSGQSLDITMLSSCQNRVILTMTSLVPSSMVSVVLEQARSRGLSVLMLGKHLMSYEEVYMMGLRPRILNGFICPERWKNHSSDKETNTSEPVSVFLFLLEGVNAIYRAFGLLTSLISFLNKKLPLTSLTYDSLEERSNDVIGLTSVRRDRQISEFFSLCHVNSITVSILSQLSNINTQLICDQIMSKIPSDLGLFEGPRKKNYLALFLVGQTLIDVFPQILIELLQEFAESPIPDRTYPSPESGFVFQERPSCELIGVKHIPCITPSYSYEISPYVIGTTNWFRSTQNMKNHPAIVVILRCNEFDNRIHCDIPRFKKLVAKRIQARKNFESDSDFSEPLYNEIFCYRERNLVLRFMLNFFTYKELLPDSCPSWYRQTQWPVYLPENHWILRDVNPHLELFTKPSTTSGFRAVTRKAESKALTNGVTVLPPTSLSVPAEILLKRESSLSFIQIDVDWNFPRQVVKALLRLWRDMFSIVGLSFPGVSYFVVFCLYFPQYVNLVLFD